MPRARVDLAVISGDGLEFEVICIRPGPANGLEYPAAVLAESAPRWQGVTSFVDHASALDRTRPGGRSVRDVCGVIADPAWDADRGVVARLRLSGPAGDAVAPLLAAIVRDQAAGLPVPNVGLSADLFVAQRDGRVALIERVYSVDVVVDPAAGGRVERALNASLEPPTNQGDEPMPESSQPAESTPSTSSTPPTDPPPPTSPTMPSSDLQAELDQARAARRELTAAYLRTTLAASGLPEPMQEDIAARLAARPDYTVADVHRELDADRALWAALQEDRTVRHLGAQVGGLTSELDRLQLACDRLVGAPGAAGADVPRLSGIRELYLLLSGDYEMRGLFVPERVTLANITTATLSSIVKNALNKVLVQSFEARPQWWQPIVVEEDYPSLNDVTLITLGGFGDLSTVAEGATYNELPNLTDAEEVSPWTKKGGYIGITIETIDRDDVAAVRQIPRKLGLAAWRTLSASVAALFTEGDVGPYWPSSQVIYHLFDSQYKNLGMSPLSASSWDATVQAVFKQTEAGSGKRLGVRPRWLLVPIELEKIALTILKSAGEPGTGNNDANVRAGTFGVITVPEFTDTTDWAAACDPADMPGICIGYRFSRAPELFIADEQVVGSMFTNDEMRIKVRFLYTIGVADCRALYKHNAA